jgi:RNA polymerase sigma factor (sigma-70 family)
VINLTMDTIRAARDNDLGAVGEVVREMDERVSQLARKAATGRGESLAEDFAQVGRIAVWEALPRFNGNSVAEFFTFMNRTAEGAITGARLAETRQGVSRDVARDFETALSRSGGDPYDAERWAQSDAAKPRKMSPEMALAARLAWQGIDSLDAPVSHRDGQSELTLGDVLDFHGGLDMPEELLNDRDRQNARQRAIRDAVHTTLDKMGAGQRAILEGTYGIERDDTPYFGTEHEADFAEHMGCTVEALQRNRPKAKSRFRVLYLAGAGAQA